MLTKLTLSIDDQVVQKAKHYAQVHKRSISRMVEEYLKLISSDSLPTDYSKLPSPKTDKIVGIAKDNGKSTKELLLDALLDKHL